MTDKRPKPAVAPESGSAVASPSRLFSQEPQRKRGRYQSFLLSTLFTYGGDE